MQSKTKKKREEKNEKVGLLFYFFVCTFSLIFAIFFSVFFYFFLFIAIFSAIIILWWGKVHKGKEIGKKHGRLLKLIYWLGFFCFIAYIALNNIMTGKILLILLIAGLGAMFFSMLVANMLYKKAMLSYLRTKLEKKEGEERKEKVEEKEEEKKKKIKTQIDELFELLQKNKKLKLGFIMKKFGLDREMAIEWCNILAEHGLAEMHYPTFGEVELRKKEK